MNTTDIIDKIRQLRSLSKSQNVFESAAAAAAADKLIEKYRISEVDLYSASDGGEEPTEDSSVLYETARTITWKFVLADNLSAHYGCALWNNWESRLSSDFRKNSRRVSRYRLVGRKSDREIVSYMFAWLSMEIERLTKLNCKGQGHIACQSYAEGAVAGIKHQMDLSKAEVKKEAQQAGQTQALIKLDARQEESNAALSLLHPNLVFGKKKIYRHIDRDAYGNGVRAGESIHLGKAMGGAGPKLLGA